ncbi:WW domain [Phytophthora cactorum]|nr:WW domain [Phytophthora cactorum]
MGYGEGPPLFLRLQSQHISRAFRKWNAFLMFERNKIKANMFLNAKATECIVEAVRAPLSSDREQRVVRGDLARLLGFECKKSRKRQAKLEHEAACLLQRCYRGYTGKRLARALFKAQRETLAACRIQRAFRNFQRRELLRVIQQSKLENDTISQRERKRLQLVDCKNAVLRFFNVYSWLSRTMRVLRMREQIRAALTLSVSSEVATRGSSPHAEDGKQCKERQALERSAAIRIQTRWRCFITRKHYLIDKQRRVEAQKLERFQRLTSAVVIQSLFRGYLARRAHSQRTRVRAALRIQKVFRGKQARKMVQELQLKIARKLVLHLSAWFTNQDTRCNEEMEKRKQQEELRITQNHAALVIQCAIRRAGARRELARQREEEEARRKEEAQELARLRLETLMQQHEIDTRVEQDKQKKLEAQRLRERLEAEKQAQQEKEAAMRTQENEELAAMKLASMLPTKQEEQEKIDRTLQQEAEHLKQAALAIQKDQARMKIQALCLKHVARKRLAKLQQAQSAAMASIQDEEQRLRLQAEQQKELALARLKVMMDDEARAREQEIKELEVQMLERARKEKERIALRNSSARKIQSRARGYLARQRVKAIQHKIEKEREDRAKAMQETIEAAEAEVAEALIEAGEDKPDAAEGSEETKADEWVEYWDENAQASYFYNIRTQEARVESVMEATGLPEEREQDAASGYVDYAVTGQVDANGFPVPAAAAESYADEYGYYDQYGQYHYYEQNNAAYYGAPAYGQGYPQMMGVQPNYAAAAAANYAYQAAAAMAFGQAMMYGAPGMGYGNPAMVQPVQQYPQAPADEPPAETENAGEAVPPDPWEKFYDQYTGAAYYYNNITGEQYWA